MSGQGYGSHAATTCEYGSHRDDEAPAAAPTAPVSEHSPGEMPDAQSLSSVDGSNFSSTSVDTVTFAASHIDVSLSSSRDEAETPPPLLSRPGKFKKCLHDRFLGQRSRELISTDSAVCSDSYSKPPSHCVEKLLSPGRDASGCERKSRSMDEGDQKYKSMNEGACGRSSSFDPSTCDTAASVLGEESPLDLSRSATSLSGRDACRSVFEARARERHRRKRSESEENLRRHHSNVAIVMPSALGRLCYSEARIDRLCNEGGILDGTQSDKWPASILSSSWCHAALPLPDGRDLPPSAQPQPCYLRHRQRCNAKGSSHDDCSLSALSDEDGRLIAIRNSTATPPQISSASRAATASSSPQQRYHSHYEHTSSPTRQSPTSKGADDLGIAAATASEDASSGGGGAARLHFCHVCDRSFSRSDMLTRHVRLHTGLKPYECALCGQQFSRSDHLSTHQRTHTGERPYRCPHCPYAACRRDMITRHLRVHGRSSSGGGGGGGSSEDDGSMAAAGGAVSAADVKAKRRRLLHRGAWSSGSSSAAGDGSSSWESSGYSLGSSIESGGGSVEVASTVPSVAFGPGGGGGPWLQAPRIDPGRMWRWSSNGSSSSSSGLGASMSGASPDSRTTALPAFADSWAEVCDRGHGAESAAGAGCRQLAATTSLERVCPGGKQGAAPTWSGAALPLGYGRQPAAAFASSAAFLAGGHAAYQQQATGSCAPASDVSTGRSEWAATIHSQPCGTSAAAREESSFDGSRATKERKSLVRQDASMEQEEEAAAVSSGIPGQGRAPAADLSSARGSAGVLPSLQQPQKMSPLAVRQGYSAVNLSHSLSSTATPTAAATAAMDAPPRQASLSDELGKVTMAE